MSGLFEKIFGLQTQTPALQPVEETIQFTFPPERGEKFELKVTKKGGVVVKVMFTSGPDWDGGNAGPIGSQELFTLRKECQELLEERGLPPKWAKLIARCAVAGFAAGRFIDVGRGQPPKKFKPTPPVLVKKPTPEQYKSSPLANFGEVDEIRPPGLGYQQRVARDQHGDTVAMLVTNFASWSGPHAGAWDRQLFLAGLTAGKCLREIPGHRKWLRQLA
jgi:hypothetical protein